MYDPSSRAQWWFFGIGQGGVFAFPVSNLKPLYCFGCFGFGKLVTIGMTKLTLHTTISWDHLQWSWLVTPALSQTFMVGFFFTVSISVRLTCLFISSRGPFGPFSLVVTCPFGDAMHREVARNGKSWLPLPGSSDRSTEEAPPSTGCSRTPIGLSESAFPPFQRPRWVRRMPGQWHAPGLTNGTRTLRTSQ